MYWTQKNDKVRRKWRKERPLLILLWSLWFGAVPVWENSHSHKWMPRYRPFFSKYFKSGYPFLFNFISALVHWDKHTTLWHTLEVKCWASVLPGCILWNLIDLMSVFLYSSKNIQDWDIQSLNQFGQKT